MFPHEPLVRVRGPIVHAQLVETTLLTLVNYQTLVATKAARVCQAAHGAPVLEFGLRRAQGLDGGLGGSRAAYIGGVAGTSNVLAGKMFGIPVRGTHAHSWVMFHESEPAAFRAYAAALPGNCTFLVDTYDTIEGVANAVAAGRDLRATGHALGGIRLDSGDLAHLSIQARAMLDEAGFPDAKIVASNDLDETLIGNIIDQGARIDVWGVGTKLVTCYDQPALGGVYKLGASKGVDGAWRDAIKLSEQPIKISNPGVLASSGCVRAACSSAMRSMTSSAASPSRSRCTTSSTPRGRRRSRASMPSTTCCIPRWSAANVSQHTIRSMPHARERPRISPHCRLARSGS